VTFHGEVEQAVGRSQASLVWLPACSHPRPFQARAGLVSRPPFAAAAVDAGGCVVATELPPRMLPPSALVLASADCLGLL
jgi:hypothetical protein